MHEDFIRTISARIAEAERGEGSDPRHTNIVFVIGDEYYAIPILPVREVMRTPQLTPVPTAPPYIQGVFVHKGKVIPVIDTVKRFHGELTSPRLPPHLLVLEHKGLAYGFLVDRVVGAMDVPNTLLQDTSHDFPHYLDKDYILGRFSLSVREKREGFQYDFFIASPKTKDLLAEEAHPVLQEKSVIALDVIKMVGVLERDVAMV